MPLQIRRGPTSDRLNFTPAPGEIIFDTNEQSIYIGDGLTQGGIDISKGIESLLEDTSPQLSNNLDLNGHDVTGTGNINIAGNLTTTGSLTLGFASINSVGTSINLPAGSTVDGVLIGSGTGSGSGIIEGSNYRISIAGDDSTILVDSSDGSINAPGGITGNLVGNVTGDLTGSVFADDSSLVIDGINGLVVADIKNIETTTDNLISINGSCENFTIIGDSPSLRLVSETNSGQFGESLLEIFNNHIGSSCHEITFYRSNGDYLNPTQVQNNDIVGSLTFFVHNGSSYEYTGGINHTIVESLGIDNFKSETSLFVRDGSISNVSKALTIKSTGTVEILAQLDVGQSIKAESFIQFGSLTTVERNALTALNGMVIYNTTNNRFEGYQNGNWINLDDGSAAS